MAAKKKSKKQKRKAREAALVAATWEKALEHYVAQSHRAPASESWPNLVVEKPYGTQMLSVQPTKPNKLPAGSTSTKGHFESTAASQWSTSEAVNPSRPSFVSPVVVTRDGKGVHIKTNKFSPWKTYRDGKQLLVAIRAERQMMQDARLYL